MKPEIKEPCGVSAGTLRQQDLLHSFASELECLTYAWLRSNPKAADAEEIVEQFMVCGAAYMIGAMIEQGDDSPELAECASELIDNLVSSLNAHAGAGLYFGTSEGDGADFGFWFEE